MSQPKDDHVDVTELGSHEQLLQVHLAEYQALTNRCSYWTTVQVALLPLFLILIGIVAQLWNMSQNRNLLVWGGMIILQLLIVTYLHIGIEIYQAVCYMECELRPLVRATLCTHELFWRYERFLVQRRGKGPIWEEYILPLCDFAAMILTTLLFLPDSKSGYAALGVNLLLMTLILTDTWRFVDIRRRFTKCILSI